MRRKKPHGWPKLMTAKPIVGGVAYYWSPPTWAIKAGCTSHREPLGTNYGEAKRRCDEVLNPQYDAWRTRGDAPAVGERLEAGTFDWMASIYKRTKKFTKKNAKGQHDFDAALRLVSSYELKDGRTFGSLQLASINAGACDRIYEKLRHKADGGFRERTAWGAIRICCAAWNAAKRDKPDLVPTTNPFAGVDMDYTPKQTRPVTHDELLKFVAAADQANYPSIGTAAMIAFYWLQREEDIRTRLSWSHYRLTDAPDMAKIFHHKTGALVDLPLVDDDGTVLWPELMARLDTTTRVGTLIVMRDTPRRRRSVITPWTESYFQHTVADIRKLAGLSPDIKFMGLRHGGNTEGANAELTDAQLRALSGHKTPAMTQLYAKQTVAQRKIGARKRLNERTKKGNLSE